MRVAMKIALLLAAPVSLLVPWLAVVNPSLAWVVMAAVAVLAIGGIVLITRQHLRLPPVALAKPGAADHEAAQTPKVAS